MFTAIFAILFLLLELTAFFFMFRAIRTARTSQGALGWAMFLLFLPFVAVPTYMFLGNWRYEGYVVARRKSEELIAQIYNHSSLFEPTNLTESGLQNSIQAIAGLPIVRGNDMQILIDANETFGAMFDAIRAAQRYVLVQFYIINDDDLGRALKDALIDTARRGIPVRLLYDAVGSKGLTHAYLDDLTAAGIQHSDINTVFGRKSRFQLNFRNHRKTVIVDGSTGFTGGFNVGDEYAGKDPKFGNWRDTHCRLTGPMVLQLQLVFAEDWLGAAQENLLGDLYWQAEAQSADMNGVILATGPADEDDMGAYYYCALIHAAQSRLWIASPYLAVENDILSALKLASMRGVEVRLMLPRNGDHLATWLAAFAYLDELRSAGIEIWFYGDGFMHQKVVLVDDDIASIGTINLDNRSCRLNFEATAVLFDPAAAKAVKEMLETDFTRSERLEKELDDQPLYIRLGAPIARLFAPLL